MVADAAGEVVEGVADVASLARDDEVDGGAAVAAPVAAPALFAVVAVEDAERRGPSGLRVLRVRAVPLRRTKRADVRTEQVVGQVGQVDRGQQMPLGRTCHAASTSSAGRAFMRASVSQIADSLGPRT